MNEEKTLTVRDFNGETIALALLKHFENDYQSSTRLDKNSPFRELVALTQQEKADHESHVRQDKLAKKKARMLRDIIANFTLIGYLKMSDHHKKTRGSRYKLTPLGKRILKAMQEQE